MIPKKIHYCWFGSEQLPSTANACIASWKKQLEGYQICLWNEKNSPMDHPFVQSAYKAGKYAFVSDYVRFWALYQHGGIYLDTDMLVLKHFDDLLDNEVFFGLENEKNVNASIIGCQSGNQFVSECRRHYDEVDFEAVSLDGIAVPQIMYPIYQKLADNQPITVYVKEYFYPYPFKARCDGDVDFWKFITDKTLAVHLWDASWIDGFQKELGQVETSKLSFVVKLMKQNLSKLF